MSYADFMNGKSFGKVMYRPISDWFASLDFNLDNLKSNDVGFAKFGKRIVERDIAFVEGTKINIVAVSSPNELARNICCF